MWRYNYVERVRDVADLEIHLKLVKGVLKRGKTWRFHQ